MVHCDMIFAIYLVFCNLISYTGTDLKFLDRSAVSVNLLKANLAQDGCEEAQLNVAKKLLSDESNEPTATKSKSINNVWKS